MFRDILVMFEYERKRRPELAALAENIGSLSVDQIKALDVPMPWMRDALLRLKDSKEYAALTQIVDRVVVEGVTADPIGEMRQWQGGETYIDIGRGRWPLLLTSGALFWLDSTGIWFDTLHAAEIDPRVLPNSTTRGSISRSDYNTAVRQQTSEKHISESKEPIERIRFFRPG